MKAELVIGNILDQQVDVSSTSQWNFGYNGCNDSYKQLDDGKSN